MSANLPPGAGRIRYISVPAPAAGAEITVTQDIRTRWRIIGAYLEFNTDANVANRNVLLRIMHGTDVLQKYMTDLLVPAGANAKISFGEGQQLGGIHTSSCIRGALSGNLVVNDEVIIVTQTLAIQVGDQYTTMVLMVEEWIEPLA